MNKTTIATFIILITLAVVSVLPGKANAQTPQFAKSGIVEICALHQDLSVTLIDLRRQGVSRYFALSLLPDEDPSLEHGEIVDQLLRMIVDYIYDQPLYHLYDQTRRDEIIWQIGARCRDTASQYMEDIL